MNRSETIRIFGTTPCVSPDPLAIILDYIDCSGSVKGGNTEFFQTSE
jgi:hypothetical protein